MGGAARNKLGSTNLGLCELGQVRQDICQVGHALIDSGLRLVTGLALAGVVRDLPLYLPETICLLTWTLRTPLASTNVTPRALTRSYRACAASTLP